MLYLVYNSCWCLPCSDMLEEEGILILGYGQICTIVPEIRILDHEEMASFGHPIRVRDGSDMSGKVEGT